MVAAQEELARRTRAHADDLTQYFTGRDRMDAIDKQLRDKIQALRDQAAERRNQERARCGTALLAIRNRGEDPGEIAKLAGITQKTVRDLMKLAEQADEQRPESDGGQGGEGPAEREVGGTAANKVGAATDNGKPVARTLESVSVNEAAEWIGETSAI